MRRWPLLSKLLLVPLATLALAATTLWLWTHQPADRGTIVVAAAAGALALLGLALHLARDLQARLGSLARTLEHAAPSPGAAPSTAAGDEVAHVAERLQHTLRSLRERDAQRRRASELLEFAQIAGGFGVFDLDLVTAQMIGTPIFFELAGLEQPPLTVGRDQWLATVHPEDYEPLVGALNEAITGSGRFEAEYRTRRADGTVRWLRSRGQVLRDL